MELATPLLLEEGQFVRVTAEASIKNNLSSHSSVGVSFILFIDPGQRRVYLSVIIYPDCTVNDDYCLTRIYHAGLCLSINGFFVRFLRGCER